MAEAIVLWRKPHHTHLAHGTFESKFYVQQQTEVSGGGGGGGGIGGVRCPRKTCMHSCMVWSLCTGAACGQ